MSAWMRKMLPFAFNAANSGVTANTQHYIHWKMESPKMVSVNIFVCTVLLRTVRYLDPRRITVAQGALGVLGGAGILGNGTLASAKRARRTRSIAHMRPPPCCAMCFVHLKWCCVCIHSSVLWMDTHMWSICDAYAYVPSIHILEMCAKCISWKQLHWKSIQNISWYAPLRKKCCIL